MEILFTLLDMVVDVALKSLICFDRSDYELIEMVTDSILFEFSEDIIARLTKPESRDEYEKEKYTFLPSESDGLHPTFKRDAKRFTIMRGPLAYSISEQLKIKLSFEKVAL